jgi:chromosome segregation ATPase
MWTLEIENISGIRSAEETVAEGLNVVQASNFRGKSSFVDAVRTVMATTGGKKGTDHPLTEGVTEGSVSLSTDSDEFTVTLSREGRTGTRAGTPVLTDETDRTCARLFAFLHEDNPIRTAVRNGEDLTEYLQRPLDIESIDSKIAETKRRRDEIESQLEAAKRAGENLTAVEESITTLEQDLAAARERRDDLEAEGADTGAGENRSEELGEKRSELQRVTDNIDRYESRIERKEQALEETEAEIEALEVPDEPEMAAEVEEKRERVSALDRKVGLLADLHRVNSTVLEEGELGLVSEVERSIASDEVDCWVCGESVTAEAIEDRLAALQEKQRELEAEKEKLEAEVSRIEERKRTARKKRREKERLEQEASELRADIEEARGDLQRARERREELQAAVERLQAEIEETESEHRQELTSVKAEIKRM